MKLPSLNRRTFYGQKYPDQKPQFIKLVNFHSVLIMIIAVYEVCEIFLFYFKKDTFSLRVTRLSFKFKKTKKMLCYLMFSVCFSKKCLLAI